MVLEDLPSKVDVRQRQLLAADVAEVEACELSQDYGPLPARQIQHVGDGLKWYKVWVLSESIEELHLRCLRASSACVRGRRAGLTRLNWSRLLAAVTHALVQCVTLGLQTLHLVHQNRAEVVVQVLVRNPFGFRCAITTREFRWHGKHLCAAYRQPFLELQALIFGLEELSKVAI